jgi:hypothetical protein
VSIRRLAAACFAVAVFAAWASGSAMAVPTEIAGSPMKVYVDDQGQLQAFREGTASGIFYPPPEVGANEGRTGDAGFFLAFPTSTPAALNGLEFGFEGDAGPHGLQQYIADDQNPTTGTGTAADPFTQVTTYLVSSFLTVTQTTTYVNGAQSFDVRWDVTNNSGGNVNFKALAAADFYFEGSDVGTGIYTDGPPRFIGGTNADTGMSGGFAEVTAGSPPWSAYQALAYGSEQDQVWGKIQTAGNSTSATFDNTVVGEPVDNAGGVEWDQFVTSPLANNATATFRVTVRNAVPSALQLTPTNAGSPRGVPVTITATATNSEGTPYAGRTLRWQVLGANPGGGSAVLNGSGQAQIVDPGTNAGADTVVAFVDFNNNGTREAAEPQASALATFVDNVAPTCRVSVSGDRPVGGGQGRPLVIRVNCNEEARVTVATTLQAPAARRRSSSAQRRRRRPTRRTIKLKPVRAIARPGRGVPVRIRIPKSVRRRYAGRRLTAKITVTARDTSGNVKRRTVTRRIKLAKIKRKRGR